MKANTFAIKDDKGMVLLEFPMPIKWCELDPETARQAAECMARAAYAARYGVQPPDGRSAIAEDKRKRIANRVATVIRQLQERGRSPKYTALQVIDIVLAGLA